MRRPTRRVRKTTRALQVAGLLVIAASAAATFMLLPQASFDPPPVRMNQIGYRSHDAKRAAWIVPKTPPEEWPSRFVIREAATGEEVWSGKVPTKVQTDAATGDAVVRLDFSSFELPGEFTLDLEGVGETSPFRIADDVYAELYEGALRALTFQRCGEAVEIDGWSHPACHRARVMVLGDEASLQPLPGGWHDAGNYDRYVPPAVFAVWHLLLTASPLFDSSAARWDSDAVGLPESGNGVPDVLDEARVELSWLLQMQRDDGSVHHKLAKIDWTPVVAPEADHERQYLFAVSSAATAGFAGLTARAARSYRHADPGFARRCETAALRAWDWLESHPEVVPEGGFRNPPDVRIQGGEYGDGNDRDERFWAAAELWATTGDPRFVAGVREGFQRWPRIVERPMTWSSMAPAGFIAILEREEPVLDGGTTGPTGKDGEPFGESEADPRGWSTQIHTGFGHYAEAVAAGIREKGHPTALGGGDYIWGSNAISLSAGVLLVVADAMGACESDEAARGQLHYVLGANSLGRSFVTGFGWDPPRFPHHHPSETDDQDDPVAGFVVGGPNLSQTGSDRPARRYADTFESYHSNEVAINWNAPLVFLAGYWSPARQPETR